MCSDGTWPRVMDLSIINRKMRCRPSCENVSNNSSWKQGEEISHRKRPRSFNKAAPSMVSRRPFRLRNGTVVPDSGSLKVWLSKYSFGKWYPSMLRAAHNFGFLNFQLAYWNNQFWNEIRKERKRGKRQKPTSQIIWDKNVFPEPAAPTIAIK